MHCSMRLERAKQTDLQRIKRSRIIRSCRITSEVRCQRERHRCWLSDGLGQNRLQGLRIGQSFMINKIVIFPSRSRCFGNFILIGTKCRRKRSYGRFAHRLISKIFGTLNRQLIYRRVHSIRLLLLHIEPPSAHTCDQLVPDYRHDTRFWIGIVNV